MERTLGIGYFVACPRNRNVYYWRFGGLWICCMYSRTYCWYMSGISSRLISPPEIGVLADAL